MVELLPLFVLTTLLAGGIAGTGFGRASPSPAPIDSSFVAPLLAAHADAKALFNLPEREPCGSTRTNPRS